MIADKNQQLYRTFLESYVYREYFSIKGSLVSYINQEQNQIQKDKY